MTKRVRCFALLFAAFAALGIAPATAQERAGEPELRPPADVPGITPEVLVRAGVPGAPGKLAITARVTYEPGARVRKHYHTGQVVFYVIEGAMVVQEDGHDPLTLKPGDAHLVRPGTVHGHWNASTSARLVFTEFILVDEGQRSIVFVEPLPAQTVARMSVSDMRGKGSRISLRSYALRE
jgi:quercetin dioxygenase-like cupin family protein